MKRIFKIFCFFTLFSFFAAIGCGFYAYFIESRRLVVTVKKLEIDGWSDGQNGFKIVAISDLHAGAHYMDEARIRSIVERANAQNPDLIVLLGDFVSEVDGRGTALTMPVEAMADNLKGLRAKFGVFAVIGNHDWWHDEQKVRENLERVGYRVLENQAESFEKDGEKVTVLGIEDFWKRKKVDIEKVVANIGSNRNIIAITHNPDSFDQLPKEISLLLAGHTHGGQVVIPFYGPPIVVAKREYTRGLVRKNNQSLFVTTGVSAMIRFGVPPEIAVLTLESRK
ncbi:MAG TPA: metallophosphoesterase [Pyrinomonadaceae bacterium]|jgi:predicted MPP superfamily phosphohydrolase